MKTKRAQSKCPTSKNKNLKYSMLQAGARGLNLLEGAE
jgi:hypothetical protein